MLPAHQRFQPNQAPIAGIDLRLIKNQQFAVINCSAQLRFHVEALLGDAVTFRRVKIVAIAAQAARMPHRTICAPQQRFRIRPVIGKQRAAHTASHHYFLLA